MISRRYKAKTLTVFRRTTITISDLENFSNFFSQIFFHFIQTNCIYLDQFIIWKHLWASLKEESHEFVHIEASWSLEALMVDSDFGEIMHNWASILPPITCTSIVEEIGSITRPVSLKNNSSAHQEVPNRSLSFSNSLCDCCRSCLAE